VDRHDRGADRRRLAFGVNGQEILPIGGHEMCPPMVGRSAR
jgi:hypothetical protein